MFKALREFLFGKPEPKAAEPVAPYKIEPPVPSVSDAEAWYKTETATDPTPAETVTPKKPTAKKPVAKKPVAKKPAKATAAKKSPATKPAARKTTKKSAV